MASNFAPPRRGPGAQVGKEMPGIRLQLNEPLDVVVSHIEPDGTIFVQVGLLSPSFLMSLVVIEREHVPGTDDA